MVWNNLAVIIRSENDDCESGYSLVQALKIESDFRSLNCSSKMKLDG